MAGLLALAVAMGIGRFAFTPILPMMLHDKVIDLPGASWLASANYLGYLVGALLCTAQPWIWRHIGRSLPSLAPINAPLMVRGGLTATIIFTTGMSLNESSLWPPLRFASGVASAFVFVYASSWCLAQLARRGVANMGGLIYIGPGAGIVASGLLASAMVSDGWPSGAAWMIFGMLALMLTAVILPKFRVQGPPPAAVTVGATHPAPAPSPLVNLPTGKGEVALLTFSYGLAGFGYIVTATFLPVIARQAIPGSAWLDLFWPLFGTGVMLGAITASRIPSGGDNRVLLAGCYFVQAAGIGIGIVSPSAAGFALGSLLLGLPFTAITFFAMQEVRRIRAASAPSYMGLLTALYGIGQIVGPPLVAVLLRHSATAGEGFALALEIAAAALVVGGLIFAGMARVYAIK